MTTNKCTICNKALRKIKNDRAASFRTVHKKCYKEKHSTGLGYVASGLECRGSGAVINPDDNCNKCHRDILRCKCDSVNHCFYRESI